MPTIVIQISSVDQFLSLLVEGELVAIQFMPAKFVELRFESWRQSEVTDSVKSAADDGSLRSDGASAR
eukprot:748145-Hanusia_phi.AAC.4